MNKQHWGLGRGCRVEIDNFILNVIILTREIDGCGTILNMDNSMLVNYVISVYHQNIDPNVSPC